MRNQRGLLYLEDEDNWKQLFRTLLVISRGAVGALGLGPKLVSPRAESPLAARMRKVRSSLRRRKALSTPKTSLAPPRRGHPSPLFLTASAPSCPSPHFTQEVTAAQRGAATCLRSQRMSEGERFGSARSRPEFSSLGPPQMRRPGLPGPGSTEVWFRGPWDLSCAR